MDCGPQIGNPKNVTVGILRNMEYTNTLLTCIHTVLQRPPHESHYIKDSRAIPIAIDRRPMKVVKDPSHLGVEGHISSSSHGHKQLRNHEPRAEILMRTRNITGLIQPTGSNYSVGVKEF